MRQLAAELLTLGVDLGGTKVETALVDGAGSILASQRRLTHSEKGPDRVIADILDCIENCLGEAGKRAQSVGFGVAGQVNRAGVVHSAPNLVGWRDVPFKAKLEAVLDIPVIVDNDVRVATWGERQHGAGQGVDNLVCIFIGTGIGGGIISGGQLLKGCHNTAGELGHTTVVSGGRQCHCRNRGCLEAYAGGWAIAERAQEAVRTNPQSGQRMVTLAEGIEQISAATVTRAYTEGDPLAHHLVKETAQYLAAGIVGIVNALNPCLVILGGGVIQGLPEFATMIERPIWENALEAALEDLHIVTAALGSKAGVIGAATLARDQIRRAG